jgi:uncharacterized membrane protein
MTEPNESQSSASRVFFDAVLTPHRSLPPHGFLIVMAVLCVFSFVAGTAFLLMGAWPVFGFFGLDVALIYWAFKLNYRSARAFETVTLTDASLDVRHVAASGAERKWRFEPAWVRVLFNGVEARRPKLVLQARSEVVQIGAFLPPVERQDLARAIEKALTVRRLALPHL